MRIYQVQRIEGRIVASPNSRGNYKAKSALDVENALNYGTGFSEVFVRYPGKTGWKKLKPK